jgi:uncharacterized membrane protein YjgN (DUF898 family)
MNEETSLRSDPPSQPAELPDPSSRIQFTGSGSEYFRIWIVNVFLTYLSLGIYSAWAKVRREKYFHQNTLIAGHGLDYHGKPIAILKGRIVALGLFAVYTASGAVPELAFLALGLVLFLMPFLMQRSVRFRFANSSYRGIRFGFRGTARQAYRLLLSFMLVPLAYAALTLFAFMNRDLVEDFWKSMPRTYAISMAFAGVAAGVAAIALYAALHATWRRFSINQAYFGTANSGTSITNKRYVLIYLVTLLMAVTGLIGVIALGGLFSFATSPALLALLPFVFLSTLYIIYFSVQGVLAARLQNYCWDRATDIRSQTKQQLAWFTSDLSVTSYGLLQLKNWTLTLFSLGLYRPFAVVNSAKARLEAISLSGTQFIDELISTQSEGTSAFGEEAMNAIDLDFSI